MLSKNAIDKIPKVHYYVTGGTQMGRILACKTPFHRGNGIFHVSMDLDQWEVQGNRTFTEKELLAAIEKIRDEKIAALKETVRMMSDPTVQLVEDPKWIFRLVEKH